MTHPSRQDGIGFGEFLQELDEEGGFGGGVGGRVPEVVLL